MSKYHNIYNWILTTKTGSNKLLDILKSQDLNIEENINFFLNATFSEGEVNIPDYLISEQSRIKREILTSKEKWITLSAPTSFGKTKILIDLINNFKGKIIIIAPTLSLCNEYFFNFVKLGIHISMTYLGGESKIYVLTPEKANLLFKNKPEIHFSLAIFDEFYEAFSDTRYYSFRETFDYLQLHAGKIISISPQSVDCSAMGSGLKYKKIETTISATSRIINSINIVDNQIIHKAHFETLGKKDINVGFLIDQWSFIEKDIFKTMLSKDKKAKIMSEIVCWIYENFFIKKSKTMIFTNLSKIFQYVDLFNDFLLKFPKKEILDENFFISKILIYLDKKSPNTKLRLLIQNRIGYHHGRMDKYLRFLIECAYRAGELTLLICNSTLSKGINLSPEFLIIDYVPIRGGENINHQSKIEYINTIGRTGRMSQKMFIGNVFVIWKNKDQQQKINELTNIKKELILEIPKNDINIKIKDFGSAVLYLIRNKDEFLQKQISKEDILFLKTIINEKMDSLSTNKLLNLLTTFYKIEWYGKTMTHWNSYVMASINKTGYTSIYNYEKKLKNGDNDVILSDVIHGYDTIINFNFKKLLIFIAEKCFKNGDITKDEFAFFNSDEDDSESYNPNWPGCFSLVFSQKTCSETELDEILNKAKLSFEKK